MPVGACDVHFIDTATVHTEEEKTGLSFVKLLWIQKHLKICLLTTMV